MIRVNAHEPGADRPHEKADGEDRGGLQQLRGLVALGKEGMGEIEREGGIDIPVEPFDEIARRAADDVAQAAARMVASGFNHRRSCGSDARCARRT